MNKLPLLFLSLVLLLGCKKDDNGPNGLPKATQEGKGTAGFLLDGKAWRPRPSDLTGGPPVTGYWRKTRGGRSLSLSFSHISQNEYTGVGFFLPDIRQAGTFVFNQVPAITTGRNNVGYGEYASLRPSPGISYFTGPDAPGELRITRFDTVSNIVSGTFQMTPREEGGSATVAITQGRFDLRFER